MDYLSSIFMGIVEGVTEFLPVSSTGHLILFGELLHFEGPPGHVFEVVIQFGAILAIVALYWRKFWDVLLHLKARWAQLFVRNILLAFLPAVVIGALAHDYIKAALFNPTVVAIALIVGGVAILLNRGREAGGGDSCDGGNGLAIGAQDWFYPVHCNGARRLAFGGDDHGRAALWRRAQGGG